MAPRSIDDRFRMMGCLIIVLPLLGLGLAVAIGLGVRL